jgi:hypothetical protein
VKKLLVLLLAVPCSLASAAYGRDRSEIKWSVGASADFQGQYYPDSLSREVEQAFGVVNGELNASMKVGRTFLLKLRPTGHWDPNNPTRSEQSWGDLPEGYLQVKDTFESTALTLQLGYNIFTWGVTDGYNPLDVVSARRYSDPLRSEKLGAFSALARLDFGWVLLEGIYIPWQRRSTLPGDKSRWLPREIGGDILDNGTIFHPPAAPVYSFGSELEYDAALKNNFGARVSSHVIGMDAAAYFFDGASTVPAVSYTLDGTVIRTDANFFPLEIAANPQIGLRPIYNRVTVTGASVTFPLLSDFLFRGEVAVTKAYRKGSAKITEHDTEAVAELEHTFNFEKGTLTAIALASWADPQDNGTSTTSTPSLTRLFDSAAGGGLRYQPTETVSAEGYAVFDLKHGGALFRGEAGYKLTDAWKVYGGGEIFSGKTTQPIGVYRKNDRAYAGIRVSL